MSREKVVLLSARLETQCGNCNENMVISAVSSELLILFKTKHSLKVPHYKPDQLLK